MSNNMPKFWHKKVSREKIKLSNSVYFAIIEQSQLKRFFLKQRYQEIHEKLKIVVATPGKVIFFYKNVFYANEVKIVISLTSKIDDQITQNVDLGKIVSNTILNQ